MRVLKSLLVIVFGATLGIVAAIAVCPAPDSMGLAALRDRVIIFWDVVGIGVGAIAGGFGAYRLYRHLTRTESHIPLTPDAEKNARAKFLPDKRNVKPGDR
jgi:hypothetical protein